MQLARRIRRDTGRLAGDPEAVALLECLAQHLFDPDLDTAYLTRVCGARREVRERLAAKVGPLKAYVAELRMLEAARRVRETEATIPQIARGLGFRVTRTFRRLFHQAYGMSATAMRAEVRRATLEATASAVAEEELPVADRETADSLPHQRILEGDERLAPRALAARLRRRLELGLLDVEQATKLRLRLRRLYPELDAAEDSAESAEKAPEVRQYPVVLRPTGDDLEEVAADAMFDRILRLPDTDLRQALLEGLRLGNVVAFLRLQQRGFALTPFDPDRALLVAELAVQLIEPHRSLMGGEADDWKALAWACLGRARLLVGDNGGAEAALGFAWEEVDGELASWAEVEVRRTEGMLRKRQRRYDEAAAAMDRAVELSRGLHVLDPKRIASVLERLELASSRGDAEGGFALVDELEGLVAQRAERSDRAALWHGFVAFHRGKAHAATGDSERAEICLRCAGDHAASDPEGTAAFELSVLGTFVVHELARLASRDDRLDDGESMLRTALERYRQLGIPVFETVVEAELAALCALRGRWAEARRRALAAATFLDDLTFHREAWQAAYRLRTLANRGAEAPESELMDTLTVLRHELDLVVWEITGIRAQPAAEARQARQ